MVNSLYDDGSRVMLQEAGTVKIHSRGSNVSGGSTARLLCANDPELFDQTYDVDTTVDLIQKNNFKRVALQFPDDIISDAPAIAYRLQAKLLERYNTKSEVVSSPSNNNNNEGNANAAAINPVSLYILGDTSYGSCCVDEINAEHVNSDFIVHYGRACLTPTKRISVHHVFGRKPIKVDEGVKKFYEHFATSDRVIVLYDLVYAYCISEFKQKLRAERASISSNDNDNDNNNNNNDDDDDNSERVIFATVNTDKATRIIVPELRSSDSNTKAGSCATNSCGCPTTTAAATTEKACCGGSATTNTCAAVDASATASPQATLDASQHEINGLQFSLPKDAAITDYKFFYIGEESSALTQIMLEYNACEFFQFAPERNEFANCKESANIRQLLMRRYYLVQKAKEASIVGIVVANLGINNYLGIIDHLKKLIVESGKKPYVFIVGKLNVNKLANFSEVDMFVIVACPQNSIVDSKDFYKPVVTPFELELALKRGKQWTGEYHSDFNLVLNPPPAPASSEDNSGSDSDSDSSDSDTDLSLITGKLRVMPRASTITTTTTTSSDQTSSALAERNNTTALIASESPAIAYFLQQRTYKGLEQRIGETEVATMVEGKRGIAKGYEDEKDREDNSSSTT